MLDQRDFTGKAALHHAVADMEERHKVLQSLLAAKAQVRSSALLVLVAEIVCLPFVGLKNTFEKCTFNKRSKSWTWKGYETQNRHPLPSVLRVELSRVEVSCWQNVWPHHDGGSNQQVLSGFCQLDESAVMFLRGSRD